MLKQLAQAGTCALFLGAAMVNVAEAGVVFGGAFGRATFDYPDVEDGKYKKFYLGLEVEDSPLFFEFQSLDSGDAEITGLPGTTLNVGGMQFGIGYRAEMNPATGSGFFFKGGFYNTDTELSDPNGFTIYGPGNTTKSGSGLYLGLGGDWMFVPNFGLRFDLEGLLGVSDFAEDKAMTVFAVGPVIKFGRGGQKAQ